MNRQDLHGYIRLDYQGRSIPSSLILRKNKPKIGKWVEVEPYECCNGTTTSTTTAVPSTTTTTTAEPICSTYRAHGSIVARIALVYEDCEGEFHVVQIDGNEPYDFCAISYSIQSPGTVELLDEECTIATTTTTVEPTTTTTTTEEETTTTTTTVEGE